MQIIEITTLDNGAHRNQTFHGVLLEGWAIIPDGMATPNFPFGKVTAEEIDGVMTVTHWYPLPIPEPEPEPDNPEPTIEERVTTLEESSVEITEALEMILSGVTE